MGLIAHVVVFVVQPTVQIGGLVGLVYRAVFEESTLGRVGLEPGLVEHGQTWDKSLKSEEFALAVEPVSTIWNWCWVVELNGVLVGTTV